MPRAKKKVEESEESKTKLSLFENLQRVRDEVAKTIKEDGDEKIITLLGDDELVNTPVISSGSIAIDKALGGGYAKGKIIEIFGPEASGKSTATLHAIADFQQSNSNEMTAFVDSENSLDLVYAKKLGVNVTELLVAQPDYGEQAVEITCQLCDLGVKLIVFDSVAAICPKKYLEDPTSSQPGVVASIMSKFLNTLNTKIKKTKTTIIFTNQVRHKLNISGFGQQGGFTTPGGRSLGFYATQRLEIKRISSEKEGDEITTNICQAYVKKNRISSPFKKANFRIVFGKGIDPISELIDLGSEVKIIDNRGAWFYYPDKDNAEIKSQGRSNFYDELSKDKKLVEKLRKEIREKYLEEYSSDDLEFGKIIDENEDDVEVPNGNNLLDEIKQE